MIIMQEMGVIAFYDINYTIKFSHYFLFLIIFFLQTEDNSGKVDIC